MASVHDSSASFSADSFSAAADSFALGTPRASASGKFWLNGEVAGCQCPECGGPMSIRLWLMTADCALCGTSLELSEEQERELQALIQRQVAPPPPPPAPAKPTPPLKQQQTQVAAPARPVEPRAKSVPVTPAPVKAKAPARPPEPARAAPPAAKVSPSKPAKREPAPGKPTAQPVPAVLAPPVAPLAKPAPPPAPRHEDDDDPFRIDWLPVLISTIFHVLLIMLLALLNSKSEPYRKPPILLTATWNIEGKEGDKKQPHENDERTVKIVPGPEKAPEPKPPEPPKPVAIEKPPPTPPKKVSTPEIVPTDFRPSDLADAKLPRLEQIQQELASTDGSRMSQGRDPRLRSQMVIHEGGTIHSEAAVANGLRWISRHQSSDGSWSFSRFHVDSDCDRRCGGMGGANSDTAATGLALAAVPRCWSNTRSRHLQRARETRSRVVGQRAEVERRLAFRQRQHVRAWHRVDRALRSLHADQGRSAAQTSSKSDRLHRQSPRHRLRPPSGGWRYSPGEAGDLSVVGWQLMALQSGRHAGLDRSQKRLRASRQFSRFGSKRRTWRALFLHARGVSPRMR